MDFRTRDTEFDLIYVNGDNTLPNLKRDEDHWKVVLTEEEFAKHMFEEQ
jgi:adenine-specific DNA-methyltransferase